MYDITGYYEAGSIEEAIELMKEHPEAKLICGGSDVLIRIREGKLAGCQLIGIGQIKEIQGTAMKEGDLWIGAGTKFSHLTNDPLIQQYIPILGEAVDQVGGPQVRNIGTIGGNICNGAVSADSAPTCFSLDARLVIESYGGRRICPIEEFYLGPGKVDLKEGEILTHILIQKDYYEGYSGHYIKYAMRNAMDIANLSCAAAVKTDKNKEKIEEIKITFGVAAPVPLRCKETEKQIRGEKIDPKLFKKVEEEVRKEINPRDSWRASKAFRLQIGGEIAKRALAEALVKGGALDRKTYEWIIREA